VIVPVLLFLVLVIALGQGQVAADPSLVRLVYLPVVVKPPPTPTPSIRPLLPLGPVGGTGGNPFWDQPPDSGRVIQVLIRSGMLLDSIEFILTTGSLGKHGGEGGDLHEEVVLLSGEYIIAFTGIAGCNVDKLSIHTNLRVFGPFGWGTGSDDPCGNGTEFALQPPPGYEIVGVWGRAGERVDQLGALARIHR
jgi:hypothetical protein